MRIAFYSPYLDSFGGGERYLLTAASIFAKNHEVKIFWDKPTIKNQLEERFNLNLKKIEITKNIFKKKIWQKFKVLKNFDLVFTLSDGSIPTPFAKKNILHFQQPFQITGDSLKNRLKLRKYIVICNSNFTKKYIDQSFGVNSIVVYPPVDTIFLKPGQKENVILSVGRFLPGGEGKKQEILIEGFKRLINQKLPASNNWSFYMAGGLGDKSYFNKLQKMSDGFPIKFFPDVNAYKLKELYGKAAIYWHAKGFEEDIVAHPEFAEHFGISVVEAQSAGCVAVVFEAGGVIEIIKNNSNGFFWKTLAQLINITKELIKNENLRRKIAANAIRQAKKFSISKFEKSLNEVIYYQ